jgi:hypothetical protein
MGRFNEPRIDEMCNDEFCLIDTDNGKNILLTREEKERIFLDSIQSYYFEGKNGLSDIQFDKLRSDLSWEGSALVNLNRNETLFMNAMQAYNKVLHVRHVLFTIKLLHKCFEFLCSLLMPLAGFTCFTWDL